MSLPAMTPSLVFLPDDLIAEVLSFLPVKPLLRFMSVSKSWKILLSDPTFVKLHLKRSAVQNPHFTLITGHEKFIPGESLYGSDDESERDYNLAPYPISRLLDNPSFSLLLDDPYYHVNNDICSRIIGSCNGLICLAETSLTHNGYQENWRREYWFRVWNPSIRTTPSEKFGYFYDFGPLSRYGGDFNFKFGFDKSTDTYKVVAFRYNGLTGNRNIKILSSGDQVWRDIAFFPAVPLRLDYCDHSEHRVCDGVYLCGTFNWLAIHNDLPYRVKNIKNKNIIVEHFVIVSLDLGTETYNQYMLPRSFEEVPSAEPTVGVLGGCVCFSYSYKETDLVIWQMKKFGVEDSWSQFLKISYKNLQIDYDIFDTYFRLVPLFLSKDGDTLILKSSQEFEAIIYHWKDNRVQRTKITPSRTITYDRRITNWVCWESAKDYVESLVPIF